MGFVSSINSAHQCICSSGIYGIHTYIYSYIICFIHTHTRSIYSYDDTYVEYMHMCLRCTKITRAHYTIDSLFRLCVICLCAARRRPPHAGPKRSRFSSGYYALPDGVDSKRISRERQRPIRMIAGMTGFCAHFINECIRSSGD